MPTPLAASLPAILATDAEANRRLRMGLGFGNIGGIFGVVFATFFLAIGHYWGALVVTLCTAGFAANRLVIKRGHLALAGNLYALLLIVGFALLTANRGRAGRTFHRLAGVRAPLRQPVLRAARAARAPGPPGAGRGRRGGHRSERKDATTEGGRAHRRRGQSPCKPEGVRDGPGEPSLPFQGARILTFTGSGVPTV